jgi:hypothetical protein
MLRVLRAVCMQKVLEACNAKLQELWHGPLTKLTMASIQTEEVLDLIQALGTGPGSTQDAVRVTVVCVLGLVGNEGRSMFRHVLWTPTVTGGSHSLLAAAREPGSVWTLETLKLQMQKEIGEGSRLNGLSWDTVTREELVGILQSESDASVETGHGTGWDATPTEPDEMWYSPSAACLCNYASETLRDFGSVLSLSAHDNYGVAPFAEFVVQRMLLSVHALSRDCAVDIFTRSVSAKCVWGDQKELEHCAVEFWEKQWGLDQKLATKTLPSVVKLLGLLEERTRGPAV